MHWQAEPSRLAPADLGSSFSRRGFAMPLARALAEGTGLAPGAGPACTPSGGGATLVTGGTGFLGSRLVARLLVAPGGSVVVVASRNPGGLRSAWAAERGEAAADALAAHPLLRLVAVDLASPGADGTLSEAVRDLRVGTVHHLAAKVHAFAGREVLHGPNVLGTLAAARTAARLGARLQLASTLSVFVSSNAGGEAVESPLRPADGTTLYGGYAQTKAASEALALGCGVPVQVVRYGLLVPEDGALLPADHFLRTFVEALADVGGVPGRATEAYVDLTPVGDAAAAAASIARTGADGVFHYANPRGAPLTGLVRAVDAALRATGRPGLAVLTERAWREALEGLAGLRATLLAAAFDKRGFLAGAARRGPLLNADLFQSTGRSFGIARALAAGAPSPPAPEAQIARLVAPLLR